MSVFSIFGVFCNKKYHNNNMILLVGASASGKTEVAKMLMKKYGIVKAITHTTREKRLGEKNAVDYFFVSKEEFLKMKENDMFVETTIYNNNFYGTSKAEINDGKVVVVDASGLKAFNDFGSSRVVTFLLEAKESTRRHRMQGRGDPEEKIKERLKNDRVSFNKEKIDKTDFVIDTDDDSIEDITDDVYKKYIDTLKKRK